MPERSEAEEHLRVIRSLMERATIYRAISAEAAAVGGVLAIAGSFTLGSWWPGRSPESFPRTEPNEWLFIGTWTIALLLAAGANLFFLYRAANRRNELFFSSGMRLALTSLAPSFIAAGWLTFRVWQPISIVFTAPIWMTCYGLALLATKHFAPRSLMWLGWAFLVTGLLSFDVAFRAFSGVPAVAAAEISPLVWKAWNCIYTAQGLMALTFGLFHLIYAACAWPRKAARADAVEAP